MMPYFVVISLTKILVKDNFNYLSGKFARENELRISFKIFSWFLQDMEDPVGTILGKDNLDFYHVSLAVMCSYCKSTNFHQMKVEDWETFTGSQEKRKCDRCGADYLLVKNNS